ncbi:Bifunctional heparan sulfate N-deacetylase/N-sulfotransferase [Gryllus bimaculatus]|nr:Bifunctional heparan sulfate N-deacetylase/N-sulfotransferase [Gryllus bimaculatus]
MRTATLFYVFLNWLSIVVCVLLLLLCPTLTERVRSCVAAGGAAGAGRGARARAGRRRRRAEEEAARCRGGLAAALLSLALLSLCLSAACCTSSRPSSPTSRRRARLGARAEGAGGGGGGAALLRAAVAAATAAAPPTDADEDDDAAAQGRVHFARTSRRLPQAIIIGVRKCGTRALLEMLALHPRVQKAAGEVHFFDRDDNYQRGLDWYRRRMPHSFRGQITVPERIYAMNASVRLLLIVREPVTRAISDYTQLRSHAATAATAQQQVQVQQAQAQSPGRPPPQPPPPPPQPPRTFEQLALRPDGSVNTAYRPLAISMYHTYLHRWLEVFQRHQLLVVNGDALIADPVPELRRIERFLGLEPRLGPHNFYFNRTKGFYCLRNATAGKCLRESKGRRHPRVDPRAVGKLRRFFAEHNQRLYELLGQDLGWPEE